MRGEIEVEGSSASGPARSPRRASASDLFAATPTPEVDFPDDVSTVAGSEFGEQISPTAVGAGARRKKGSRSGFSVDDLTSRYSALRAKAKLSTCDEGAPATPAATAATAATAAPA
eukprot:5523567-Prymnesium_polylepis.1